jgi:cytohesin
MIKLKNIFNRKIDIYKAISDENVDLLEKGLKNGINADLLDDLGQSPVFRVVYNKCDKQEKMLNLLFEYDADPNFKKEPDGATVIHYAKSKKIAEILIDNGADVKIRTNYGSTPLHQAFSREMAEFFVQQGLDVNAKDNNESTPLFDAVYFGFDLVKYLIEQGAEIEIKNKNGWTPLICLARTEYADYKDNIEIKRICDKLTSNGAKIDTMDNDMKDAYQHAIDVENIELAEYLKNKKTKTQQFV